MASIGNELWPLRLEHLPYGFVRLFGMTVGLGIGHAFVDQPGVQLIQALDPKPRGKEALPHQPNLVLDLPCASGLERVAPRRRSPSRMQACKAVHCGAIGSSPMDGGWTR